MNDNIFNIGSELDDLKLGVDFIKNNIDRVRDEYDYKIKRHFQKVKNADITDCAGFAFGIAGELFYFYMNVVLDNLYQIIEKKITGEYQEPEEYQKLRENGYRYDWRTIKNGFTVDIEPNDELLDKKVTFTVRELGNFISEIFKHPM